MTDSTGSASTDQELAAVVRREVARIVSATARWCGDLALAEDAVADAVVEALAAWRRTGLPPRPGGWLQLAARRNALDRLRRDQRQQDKLALLEPLPIAEPDATDDHQDDLALLFACCHPAIGRPAQLALTLRAVIGLTTSEIARALLSQDTAIAQRITRAKKKIVANGIRLAVPAPSALADRLDEVLTVVYLAYNEGHLTTAGAQSRRRDLADDAQWLADALAARFPDEAEALGLQALLVLLRARDHARWTPDGALVRLEDQDRSLWDRGEIERGIAIVERAGALRRPGRFQLQAAIAALHAEAPSYASTDWFQIVTLYDMLRTYDPSPVVQLNRAVAAAHVLPVDAALADVDALAADLADYSYLHSVRAHLLRQLGRDAEAVAADLRARSLTQNPAERALLAERIAAGSGESVGDD